MRTVEFSFDYPSSLVATSPGEKFRCAYVSASDVVELNQKAQLLQRLQPGDVLVVNDTQVIKRRVFTPSGLEVLFLKNLDANIWRVLFPARRLKVGDEISLPQGRSMRLLQKGLPQLVETDQILDEEYFQHVAELALPPYIQQARGERHNSVQDDSWYQTEWAQNKGSFAAPTASLHFSNQDLSNLQDRGVHVVRLTLHVGLGTFLPVKSDQLSDHTMHAESVWISNSTLETIEATKARGHKVWALGTTVARALESWAHGYLQNCDSGVAGETDIFITPGFQFRVVDRLLTNFHQPQSTLLAMVAAFVGLERVKQVYAWAIHRNFKLFSYGDLSVWERT